MKIQLFDGGLNTRLRPQLLAVNEAVEYTNVDNSTGILAPIAGKVKTTIETNEFVTWYKAGEEFISSATPVQTVEFQKRLYTVDGVNQPTVYDGTTTRNLGIEAPTVAPLPVTTLLDTPTEAKMVSQTGGSLPATSQVYIFVNGSATVYSNVLAVEFDLLNGNRINTEREDLYNEFGNASLNNPRLINSSQLINRRTLISEVKGIVYGDIGVQVYRLYAAKYRLVGTLTSDADSLIDNVYDISANAEYNVNLVGSVVGSIQYLYTYYNSATGYESAPSAVSTTLKSNGAVTVNNLTASPDPQVTDIRLYRVGGNLTLFSLVVELPNVTINYVDDNKDTEIIGTILTSQDSQNAPNTLQFITEAYAMLFAAEGSKLRFTPIGQPTVWPETFFLNFDGDITGMTQVASGLLVFTKFRTFIVTGTGPTTLAQYLLSDDQGCISYDSIQVIGSEAIWASTDGLCTSSGGGVIVVTKNKLGKITLVPIDSEIFDEVYYLLQANGTVLCLDYRYQTKLFKYLNFGVSQLVVSNDALYGWKEGFLYKLFASTEKETMIYKSPRFVEGSVTEEKYYKKVYIYSEGDIILNILINDVLVSTSSYSSKDRHVVQVPHAYQRGQFIQFEISGTGEVFEIEYVAGRTKGKE